MKDFFKQLFKYIIPYKIQALLSVLFNFVFIVFNISAIAVMIPFLKIMFKTETVVSELPDFSFSINYFLDLLNYHMSRLITTYNENVALMFLCGLIIIMTFIKTTSRYFSLFYLAPLRTGVIKDIRDRLYSKIVNLPISYYSDEKKGDIISRITSDVQEIEASIISSLETLIKDPVMIVFYIVVLFTINPKLTIFVIVLLPLSSLFIGRIGKNLRKTSFRGQRKLGVILSIIEETISGLRIIKAFNNEDKIIKRFQGTNKMFTQILIRIIRRRSLASPLSEFLGTIVMVAILWYGTNIVLDASSNLEPDKLILFLLTFYLIINPAKGFSTAFYNLQKGMASVDRINTVLNAEITIKDRPDAISLKEFNDKVEYKNVSFKYEKELVLKNIDLRIEKGKTIALVGQSGGGKSTLADLLPRLMDIEQGNILIDGIPIKTIKLKDLRNLMGIVTQQSILFNDTVFNNIAFGYEGATEDKVVEAAKVANAHEFIAQMENGYYSNIGDSGNKLSGGQRQRLSIARAVLKNPPILILDEATSALDTESERLVQDALYRLMQNRTSIVIAHRLSTVQNADEIIVLHEGEIIEKGKHADLLEKKGIYKKLYDLQTFA